MSAIQLPVLATQCFAVPGDNTIVDVVHPVTGLSVCYHETLEQVRDRYPGAELMEYEDWAKAKADRQDAEVKEWSEVTEDQYDEVLNVLPPAASTGRGAFLAGEPQLGSSVMSPWAPVLRLADRKGGDMSEWPEDLRVREFPV